MSKYGVFSGPYFPAFGLNTERYEVSLRIQSERGKLRTRKNSVFGNFTQWMLLQWVNIFIKNANIGDLTKENKNT